MKLLLLTLLSIPLSAQSISGVTSDAISHSSFRIHYTVDQLSWSRIQYGTTTSYGKTTHLIHGNTYNPWPSPPGSYLEGWFLSGLTPSTTYHYCPQASIDSTNGVDGTWLPVCNGSVGDYTEVTSSVPGTHPANPIPVSKYNPTFPSSFAATLTASTCPQWASQITSAVAASHKDGLNYKISVDHTLRCVWSDFLSGDTVYTPDVRDPLDTGWVVSESDDIASIPSAGTRVALSDVSHMPKILDNILATSYNGTAPTVDTKCTPAVLGEFWAVTSPSVTWDLYQCQPNGTTYPITAITGNTVTPIVFTATGIGAVVSVNDRIDVLGVGGNTNANMSGWLVTAKSGDQITVDSAYGLISGNANWTSGGSARVPVWKQIVPAITDTRANILAASCTTNTWGRATDGGIDVKNRWFWCTTTNVWQQMRITEQTSSDNAPYNIGLGAHHYWFHGIGWIEAAQPDLKSLNLVSPRADSGWNHLSMFEVGFQQLNNVDPTAWSHDIVLDQCIFLARDDYSRVQTVIHFASTNNFVVKNSYLKAQDACSDGATMGECTAGAILSSNIANHVTIQNNYFEVPGITVFSNDDLTVPYPDTPGDWWVDRNWFNLPDKYFLGSGSSNGTYYGDRQHFEAKGLQRVEISGNIFEGLFTTLSAAIGTAIEMTSSATFGGIYPNNKFTGDWNIHDNIFRNNPHGILFKAHNNGAAGGGTLGRGVAPVTGARLRFANNIVSVAHRCTPWMCSFSSYTQFIDLEIGGEDVQIIHNTFWPQPLPLSIGAFTLSLGGKDTPFEGFLFRDNIIAQPTGVVIIRQADWDGTTSLGTTALNDTFTHFPSSTSWTWDHSVWGLASDPGGLPPDATNYYSANPGWATVNTPDPTTPSTYVLTAGIYRAGQSSPASDGTDMGVNVTQLTTAMSGGCTFMLSSSSHTFAQIGETFAITLTASDPSCSWTTSSGAGWLTSDAGSSGSGTIAFHLIASSNSGSLRTTTFSMGGLTFNATQTGAPVVNISGAVIKGAKF